MKIPESIPKAKNCKDFIDVEIALHALERWCMNKHKITPEENKKTKKRWYKLIELRKSFKR